MPASIFGNPAAVVQLNQALFGIAPGNGKYTNQLDQANAIGAIPFARQLGQTVAASNESLAATVLANVGIVNATLQTALVQAFAAFPNDRGVVVLNLTNILTTLEGNAVYGAAAAQFNAQVATDFQYSTNPVNTADSPINAGTATLTANTDILTGNLFTAGLVFTPGGDDRINSLQDEDTLTGTGTNATLNATLGNANDNGAPIITPTISNVSTFNVSFSGSGVAAVNELDLQDTTGTITNLNINRINDGITTARIDNIGNAVANLSVSRSGQVGQNVDFAFTSAALAGTADSTTVTVSAVNLGTLFVEERLTTFDEGFETISLVSAGPSRNVIGTFQAEDVQTLNLSGATALTLGGTVTVTGGQGAEATNFVRGLNQVAGSLTRINGSTMTGALDLTLGAELNAPLDGTSGTPVQLNVTGGSGNDIFRIAQGASIDAVTGTNVDTIDGGMGTNTLVLLGGAAQTVNAAGTAAAPVATVLNVQGLEIRTGHDVGNGVEAVTVNANAFNALATIFVRNEGNTGGAAPVSTAEAATVTLNNLTAVQANGITIAHGTTGNNGNANNNLRANLAVSTGAADVVGVTIAEGINADPRFNFNLSTNAPGLNNVNRVESINIRNNDTESNTVTLNSFADHIGTITLTRTGAAGTFLNLDGDTANLANQVGFLQRTQDGAAPIATSNETLGRVVDVGVLATQVRLVAATVDATGETSDVTVRVSSTAAAQSPVGAQTIRMGSGNDTVIFDNLNDNRAGLTISDTVVGGLGNDTLVIDGNLTLPGVLALGASEWTNVAGFETIRLVNPGANSTYSLTLTDTLIATNNNNGILAIVNDNDANNDASRTTAQALAAVGGNDAHNAGQAGAEVSVVIDARSLNANSRFSYNGEEGASRTADRIIFSDVNINGGTVINGGAIDNINDNVGIANAPAGIVGNGVIAAFGNADIIEVRNSAVVSQGDLANVSNIGALEFTNDTAVTQVSILQLNDQIVDSMVDSFQASVSRAAALGANVEVLAVRAFDNLNVVNATTGLTIEAGSLTDRSDLTVVLGRGTNTITTGAGQDNVVVLGNFTAAEKPGIVSADGTNVTNLANGVSQAALASLATQTINVGAGIDTVTFVGGVNLASINANTVLASIENTQFASNVSMTEDQFRLLTGAGQTIRFIGGGAHTLTITDVAGAAAALDFSKITVTGGALVINNQSTDGSTGAVVLAGGTVAGVPPTTVGTTTTPAATTNAQVRITFDSPAVGTNAILNVAYQDEDGAGALVGTATTVPVAINATRLFDASTLPAGVTFDVRNLSDGVQRGDQFKKVQLGSQGDDAFSFVADTAAVYINAGNGNDTLTGGTSADFLVGGAGNDSLTGGLAADTVLAGAGDDRVTMVVSAGNIDMIDAGADIDTLVLTGAAAGTVVIDLSVAAAADQLTTINAAPEATVQSNFENVDASAMTGGGINVTGSSASNVLVGSAQADVLNGGGGADNITDGAGADMILGGAGLDSITLVAEGVVAVDTIVLGDAIAGVLAADADTITGFSAASTDVIALSKVDLGAAFTSAVGAGFSVATDFVIIAGGAATAGTDRVIYNTNNGELTFDADGNGAGVAVLLATLVGAPTISAADFTVVA